ncbi:hypothetical protein ACFFRR_010329 [Megaselia abdita]
MSSFSFNKLRNFLPNHNQNGSIEKINQRHSVSLEPEIGFQLTLGGSNESSNTVNNGDTPQPNRIPELNINLIAARHLPSTFGFKVVQGYEIKVKLFPGSKKYDSKIQTNSWPKFNENFKFSLVPDIKSSIKRYTKDIPRNSEHRPENLLSGHFVVFTVYAHLELPTSAGFNRFNRTYRSLRDKSSNLLKGVVDSNGNSAKKEDDSKTKRKNSSDSVEAVPVMTQSEAKRNLGSVTCYLEPKLFKRNLRNNSYATDELWLPIKDITTTPTKLGVNNVMNADKGQVELILEFCDKSLATDESLQTNNSSQPVENGKPVLKSQWSLTEIKKKLKNDKKFNLEDFALKVTTSRMRCSIKVKDEFENSATTIYLKTAIFEHDVLMNAWKSDHLLPTISTRWEKDKSTFFIPLTNMENLDNISIKTTVATKTKVGKKIVLGTVGLNPSCEHWKDAFLCKNKPVAAWHNFQ